MIGNPSLRRPSLGKGAKLGAGRLEEAKGRTATGDPLADRGSPRPFARRAPASARTAGLRGDASDYFARHQRTRLDEGSAEERKRTSPAVQIRRARSRERPKLFEPSAPLRRRARYEHQREPQQHRPPHAARECDDAGLGDRLRPMAGDPRDDRRRRYGPRDHRQAGKPRRRHATLQRYAIQLVNRKVFVSTIVLAYSGGLDTSVLLKKYVEAGHRVIAMTLDLGESDMVAGAGAGAALEAVRQKALALGAADAVLIDARERFIEDYAFRALRANALYEGVYPLSAALSRPLIADLLCEIAEEKGADAVAHGCTGKGNDQVRIEIGVKARSPHLRCYCPLRDEPMSRPEAIAYAQAHGVPVAQTAAKPYSGDEIIIDFSDGIPSMGGLRGAALVKELNVVAGKHGVGRLDLIEDRVVGLKSREVYECPGSLTLIAANKALERLVLTRDELRFKAIADQRYAELIYDGLWSSPLREALAAFNLCIARRMNGSIRLRLLRGQATVVGSRSPFALYDEHLATYGAGDAFKHDAAEGFIGIWGLPVEVAAKVRASALTPK